jgi:hypothetical protein
MVISSAVYLRASHGASFAGLAGGVVGIGLIAMAMGYNNERRRRR